MVASGRRSIVYLCDCRYMTGTPGICKATTPLSTSYAQAHAKTENGHARVLRRRSDCEYPADSLFLPPFSLLKPQNSSRIPCSRCDQQHICSFRGGTETA